MDKNKNQQNIYNSSEKEQDIYTTNKKRFD